VTRGGQFGQGQCRTVFLFVLFCFVCLRCLEICTHGHEAVLVDGFGFSCWLALVGSSEVVGPSTAGLGKPSCPQGVGASSSTSKKRQWKSRTGQLHCQGLTSVCSVLQCACAGSGQGMTQQQLLQTTQIISDICFITDHVAYASSNKTKIV